MVYFYNSRNAKHIAAIAGHAPFPPLPTFYFRVSVNSCLPCSCRLYREFGGVLLYQSGPYHDYPSGKDKDQKKLKNMKHLDKGYNLDFWNLTSYT